MDGDTTAKKRGRKKGSLKTGGRQKGTPNRNSRTVLESLDKAGTPLIEFLVADIQTLDPHVRIEKWFQLLRFCYPQLKEVEPFEVRPPAAPPAPSLTGLSDEQLATAAGGVT